MDIDLHRKAKLSASIAASTQPIIFAGTIRIAGLWRPPMHRQLRSIAHVF